MKRSGSTKLGKAAFIHSYLPSDASDYQLPTYARG